MVDGDAGSRRVAAWRRTRARVQTVDFTPDGRMLATAAGDGTVQLWDVATQKAIGPAVVVEPDAYLAAAFSPDGSQLFAVERASRAASG